MENQFSRTELLLNTDSIERLQKAHVAIFGVGGVGGFTVEALARAGIGNIDLIDKDEISITNINRQIIALHSTIGKNKVDVLCDRILDINPRTKVNVYKCFYLPETAHLFDFSKYDYVIDAVDNVTAKIHLIIQAKKANTKIICAMGAGNKLDPTQFEVTDIEKTSVCPLARVIRQECKKRDIKNVKVVYSKEKPITHSTPPGSISFVPSVAGLIIASEVVKDLLKK